MQVRGRPFNFKMFILSCSALGGKHCAAVDFYEISIRKLVPLLGVFTLLVVDSQMPLAILGETVCGDEVVFFLGRWLVFAPRIPIIDYSLSPGDESLGMLECFLVQFHCHG